VLALVQIRAAAIIGHSQNRDGETTCVVRVHDHGRNCTMHNKGRSSVMCMVAYKDVATGRDVADAATLLQHKKAVPTHAINYKLVLLCLANSICIPA
jgi:hypothetical protein